MRMATTRKFGRLHARILVLLILSGCVASAPDEPDPAELENRLAHAYGASGVAFSPDGKLVAVGTREKIWVADTATGDTTASLSYFQAAR